MSQSDEVHLRVLSDPRNLCKVRERVREFAARIDAPERWIIELVMAVDETVCNIIRHGYQGRKDGPIELTMCRQMTPEDARVEIVIRDQTGGDPSQIRPRPYDPARPGGFGLGIVQSTVDSVTYARSSDGLGIETTILKTLSRSADPAGRTC